MPADIPVLASGNDVRNKYAEKTATGHSANTVTRTTKASEGKRDRGLELAVVLCVLLVLCPCMLAAAAAYWRRHSGSGGSNECHHLPSTESSTEVNFPVAEMSTAADAHEKKRKKAKTRRVVMGPNKTTLRGQKRGHMKLPSNDVEVLVEDLVEDQNDLDESGVVDMTSLEHEPEATPEAPLAMETPGTVGDARPLL